MWIVVIPLCLFGIVWLAIISRQLKQITEGIGIIMADQTQLDAAITALQTDLDAQITAIDTAVQAIIDKIGGTGVDLSAEIASLKAIQDKLDTVKDQLPQNVTLPPGP